VNLTRATRLDDVAEPPSSVTPYWKVAPLRKPQVKRLAAVWAIGTAVYVVIGLIIVELWEPSAAGAADARVTTWFEDRRTDSRTHLADIGSALSNTETKIGLVLVLLPLMLWMYRRWHDWAFLTVALVLEVSVFGISSKIVMRDRPPVEQLDGAPTASWPSGHIAASVVFYVGLAMVVHWNTRSTLSRLVFAAIAVVAPLVVIVSRLYLGMHYPSDAVGGVVLGVLTLVVVRALIIESRDGRPLTDPTP
jgi:undecaprenyl-diphosphatase